jgi:creatinine amidohydrolase
MTPDSPRPFILAETNWKQVKSTAYQVAVLPWGATEAHNYHLPYATDNIQCDYIAACAASKAWDQGAKVIVLPTVPFGVNTGQMDIPLCLNMNPSTQLALLMDLVEVLANAGISKLVILNGHGGNNFKSMIRELSIHYPEVFVCAANWFQASEQQSIFAEPGDHAGEMETSCIMHITPQWVLDLSEAGDGAAKNYKPEGLRKGWVTAQRAWTQVTKDTGVGNPSKSTASKGERYLEASAEEIAKFLVELSVLDNQDLYQ